MGANIANSTPQSGLKRFLQKSYLVQKLWLKFVKRVLMRSTHLMKINKEHHLNKAELITAIAEEAELSKAKAEFALNSIMDNIKKAVTKGESVQLIGFGTFGSGKRAARVGRNPKTGEAIKIAAAKTVKFSAGKAFKDAVNKRKK